MKVTIVSLALALGLAPVIAGAQGYPGGAPSPEMRAKMEQARGDAKTASYNALSADHRSKVQAVVDKFDAGTLTDPRDAATQIDAILTPDEAKAVLAQRQTMRDAMRAAFAQSNGTAAGGPPSGDRNAPGGAAGGLGGGMREHVGGQADAGRFLLTVSANPDKLRDAMRAERERAQQ